MDTDARIMLRLIRSSDEDLNTEITKYTNSQNPLYDRDFFSNDDIQVRLQNASFETDYWYEKHRGEFRLEEKSHTKEIQIVPNEVFAMAYMAFFKQHPVNAIINSDKFFVSKKEDVEGLYESIFNDATEFNDMLASYLILILFVSFVDAVKQEKEHDISISNKQSLLNSLLPNFALSKIILTKYLVKKFKPQKSLNLAEYVINNYKKESNLFFKIIRFSTKKIQEKLDIENKIKGQERFQKLMTNIVFYETIKTEIEEMDISLEDIDNINDIEISKEIFDEETANN